MGKKDCRTVAIFGSATTERKERDEIGRAKSAAELNSTFYPRDRAMKELVPHFKHGTSSPWLKELP